MTDFLSLHPNLKTRIRLLMAETRDLKTGTLANLPSVLCHRLSHRLGGSSAAAPHFFFGFPATSDFFWWVDST